MKKLMVIALFSLALGGCGFHAKLGPASSDIGVNMNNPVGAALSVTDPNDNEVFKIDAAGAAGGLIDYLKGLLGKVGL